MNIALTGGGTAGHIIPNLALVKELQDRFKNIYYFGNSKGMEKELCKNYPVKFKHVNAIKFSRKKFFKNFLIPIYLPKYIHECKKLLLSNKIDIVFSKGGYIALPTVIAAFFLKIPVICHESDYTFGITNKITSLFAKKTITAFNISCSKRSTYIGMPIREQFYKADPLVVFTRHNINKNMPILLVLGGSLGSRIINENVLSILDKLCENFFVIHINGTNNSSKHNYLSFKFIIDIYNYIAAASVIVSRCGATSAFEIVSLNKPVLFIPLSKKASRGDQIDNANYFYKNKLANILYEENLSPNNLYREILNTYTMQKKAYRPNINVNTKIASIIHKIALSHMID